MPKKKNPLITTVLAIFLGPFSFFYIGWRYGVMAIVIFLFYIIGITIIFLNFESPSWMRYVIMLVFISKALTITTTRNQLIDYGTKEGKYFLKFIDSFTGATMAMTDMLIGMGMYYSLAICLHVSINMFRESHILKGLLMLFLGTPLFFYLTQLIFGGIAMAIDAIVAKGTKNIYSNKQFYELK